MEPGRVTLGTELLPRRAASHPCGRRGSRTVVGSEATWVGSQAMRRRQLVVVRHAKSVWAEPDLADRDRPLNARGRRAAARVGEYLREAGVHPDLVLCSPARRAQQTLELFQLAKTTDVLIEDQLYGA